MLEKRHKITSTLLASGPEFDKSTRILDRTLERHDNYGACLAADARHVKGMVKHMNCGHLKSLAVPIEKNENIESDHDKDIVILKHMRNKRINSNKHALGSDTLFDARSNTLYRAAAARAKYLVAERADVAFAVKECGRRMSSPTTTDWARLERVVRYLKRCPTVRQWFVFQPEQARLVAFTDTDWAGCRQTRRSTNGGCIRHGRHVLRTWCAPQALVALSSGEAALYGAVKGSSELLGMLSAFVDFWLTGYVGEVMGDANAALGIIRRQGLGRLRHLDTNWLWVQDCAAQREAGVHQGQRKRQCGGPVDEGARQQDHDEAYGSARQRDGGRLVRGGSWSRRSSGSIRCTTSVLVHMESTSTFAC